MSDVYSNYPYGFPAGLNLRGLPLHSISPGNVWWVGNNTSGVSASNGNSGKDRNRPFSTIDYAVGRCVAGNGDLIFVLPGHTEQVEAAGDLDLDVAGISIVFLGEGSNRATINFKTAVTADMDVDAVNITLYKPRFTAGIDALTGPIDINADNFTIWNGEYHDGTGIDTTDCIVGGGVDTLRIHGWKYYKGDEAGTQKQSHIQVGAATKLELSGIDIEGDFATGIIENGTAWTDAVLRDIVLENINTGPVVGILLQATSNGSMLNVNIRVASGTTYLTADNDMQFFNCFGVGVDADAGQSIGTLGDSLSNILGDDNNNNAFASTNVAANKDGSIIERLEQIMEAVNPDSGTSLGATESLADILYAPGGIATFPASALPANNVSIAEVLREVYDQQEKSISGSTAVMVNGDTIFTIANGPIELLSLISECIALNDGTASTLQYSANPTVGAATTFSGASASLANANAGSGVVLNMTGLITAPDLIDPLVGLTGVHTRGITVGAGIITIVIATGSTTGTWKHYLRWRPLARGVTVVAT